MKPMGPNQREKIITRSVFDKFPGRVKGFGHEELNVVQTKYHPRLFEEETAGLARRMQWARRPSTMTWRKITPLRTQGLSAYGSCHLSTLV
jgi:hypothetical protein